MSWNRGPQETRTIEAIVLRESGKNIPPEIAQQLVSLYFGGVPTYTLELFHQIYWRKVPIYRLNPTWLFQEGFNVAREPVFERMKRANDLVLAALACLSRHRSSSRRPWRYGWRTGGPPSSSSPGSERIRSSSSSSKLRTMRLGSETSDDPYTRPGDARVTRVGRILRTTRLDELPQLWNVLQGDMSMIGPRAEWDRLAGEYERQIPCYYFRHLVKPGITGWAQVNFTYGASLEDTVRKLEYDLYYIRNFSFLLDAAIVLKTVQIMLFGKGR